jgi:hypothetical protein
MISLHAAYSGSKKRTRDRDPFPMSSFENALIEIGAAAVANFYKKLSSAS